MAQRLRRNYAVADHQASRVADVRMGHAFRFETGIAKLVPIITPHGLHIQSAEQRCTVTDQVVVRATSSGGESLTGEVAQQRCEGVVIASASSRDHRPVVQRDPLVPEAAWLKGG